jgi:hypothetical protein
MKPATRLTFIVVTLIALLHVLRLIVGVTVVVGGAVLPLWPSVVAALFFGALAAGLWREHATRTPAA